MADAAGQRLGEAIAHCACDGGKHEPSIGVSYRVDARGRNDGAGQRFASGIDDAAGDDERPQCDFHPVLSSVRGKYACGRRKSCESGDHQISAPERNVVVFHGPLLTV
jgi:hypothetical protein